MREWRRAGWKPKRSEMKRLLGRPICTTGIGRGEERRRCYALPEHCFAVMAVGALTSYIHSSGLDIGHADMKAVLQMPCRSTESAVMAGGAFLPFPSLPSLLTPPLSSPSHQPQRPHPNPQRTPTLRDRVPSTPSPVPCAKATPPLPQTPAVSSTPLNLTMAPAPKQGGRFAPLFSNKAAPGEESKRSLGRPIGLDCGLKLGGEVTSMRCPA